MAQKKAREIELSREERDMLEQLIFDPRTPENLAVRMKIVLMASDGQTNGEIERILQLSHGKAKKWRNRYAQRHNELLKIEREANYKLRENIVSILGDAERRTVLQQTIPSFIKLKQVQ